MWWIQSNNLQLNWIFLIDLNPRISGCNTPEGCSVWIDQTEQCFVGITRGVHHNNSRIKQFTSIGPIWIVPIHFVKWMHIWAKVGPMAAGHNISSNYYFKYKGPCPKLSHLLIPTKYRLTFFCHLCFIHFHDSKNFQCLFKCILFSDSSQEWICNISCLK